ncbi:MAG: hypothetical protein ABIH42_07240 [Planctomycetota bacterium]
MSPNLSDKEMPSGKNVEQVLDFVKYSIKKEQKSAKVAVVIRIIVLIVVIGYMTWLNTSLSKLEPDLFVGAIRAKISDELPDISLRISHSLKENAPQYVEQARQQSFEIIGQLKEWSHRFASDRLKQVGELIKQKLAESVKIAVDKELDKIETEQLAQLSSDQKVTLILDKLRSHFSEVVKLSMSLMTEEYNNKIKAVEIWVVKLKKAENLSKRELEQKKLLEAVLKLIKHKTKDGFLPNKPK